MNYRGLVKGKTIELDESLPFPDGQAVRVAVEPWAAPARPGSPQAIRQAMHAAPHLLQSDVAALQAAIAHDRIPVSHGPVFREDR